MRPSRLVSLLIAAAVLSACGGNGSGSPQGTSPLIPPQGGGTSSTMARDTESQDLLYVANRKDGSVFVYSYPEGKAKGSLLDVKASGLCSDSSGNVFVPAGREILKYAHGGARPIEALRDPLGGATQFCAVDPASGDLAVSGG